ncbi:NUDIX domain-containing protein [Paludibacterium yongneupense]|uniref:NUDIX domain-containing protein n=1 Tax=Paludibacterium yongneupense TaxID=400061 RepID=UPI001FE26491|nr:NUDIX domain-containing protein [Paludibacterium yongneupense]
MPDDKKPFTPLSPDLPRRATAIIELADGLLVSAPRGSRFTLPGGFAHRGELRSQALIREIREDTGLRINSMLYLFDHITPLTAHRVYLAIAQGHARAQGRIGRIALVSSPETELELDYEARAILRRYARLRAEVTPKGDALRGILGLARYIAKVD